MSFVPLEEARAFFRSFIDDGEDADPASMLARRPVPVSTEPIDVVRRRYHPRALRLARRG